MNYLTILIFYFTHTTIAFTSKTITSFHPPKIITMSSNNNNRPIITIFSITNCKYCTRAKSLLTSKSFPFTEINIEHYPPKRNEMLKLSKSLTVPQIFFGNVPIGGCDDLEKWLASNIVNYEDVVKEFLPEEYDEGLSIPSYPPVKEEPLLRDNDTFQYLNHLLSHDDTPPYVQIADMLKDLTFTSLEQLKRYLSTKTSNPDLVQNMLNELQDYQMIVPTNGYKLQQFHTPLLLNSYRIWKSTKRNDPFAILTNLKSKLDTLKSKYTHAGLVDYKSMKLDPEMSIINEASCELQTVSLSQMNDSEKKAFCINLYNIMITHAFVMVGIPTDTSNRGPFFESVKYTIGSHSYSFSELENGVLRGNKIPPGKHKPFFDDGDERLENVCDKVDPRIHFALNCGAKSCPPIRKFTKEGIEEELHVVSLAYCSEPTNVLFDNGTLYLNQIFNWYGSDFGTPEEIGWCVAQWILGEKRRELEAFLEGGLVRLEFLDYDWTSDALDPLPFDLGMIEC